MSKHPNIEQYRHINFAELSNLLGSVTRNTIRRWSEPKDQGGLGFPQHYALSAGKVVWSVQEVLDWIAEGKGRAGRFPNNPQKEVKKIFEDESAS